MSLIFPPGQRFDCGSCTRCCRGAWNIHVDPYARRRIEGSPVYQRLLAERGRSPLVVDKNDDARTRMEDGTCVFLEADGMCGVHRTLGPTAKPLGCTQFPFVLRPTPDGVYVGLSFFCSAVQTNSGRPVEEHAGELQRLMDAQHFPPIRDPLQLDASETISWAAYCELESGALDTLDQTPHLRDAMWRVATRIVHGAEHPRDASFEDEQRDLLVAAIESTEHGTRARHDTAPFHQAHPRRGGAAFRRFVEHLLFRKFLAHGRTVRANASAWLMTLPLLEWYRDRSAFEASRAPDDRDTNHALEVVERCFATHAPAMDPHILELRERFRRRLESSGGPV